MAGMLPDVRMDELTFWSKCTDYLDDNWSGMNPPCSAFVPIRHAGAVLITRNALSQAVSLPEVAARGPCNCSLRLVEPTPIRPGRMQHLLRKTTLLTKSRQFKLKC